MALSEAAKEHIEKYRNTFKDSDVDDLLRLLDPAVNPPKAMVPTMKRAAEELIQEKQLQQISEKLAAVLNVEEREDALDNWRKELRSLKEAEVLFIAHDVRFITPHLWARYEATAEIERRSRRRADQRYWVTTAIAIFALILSAVALLRTKH